MIKLTLVFLITILLSESGRADEGFKLRSADAITKKVYDLNNSKGKVHVMVHSKGHLQGMPYVIDLRPACEGSSKSWEELETLDVKSACAVDMNSLKINDAKTEISINIHNPSVKSYDEQMKKGVRNVQPTCEPKAVKHTFSIKDFCA